MKTKHVVLLTVGALLVWLASRKRTADGISGNLFNNPALAEQQRMKGAIAHGRRMEAMRRPWYGRPGNGQPVIQRPTIQRPNPQQAFAQRRIGWRR